MVGSPWSHRGFEKPTQRWLAIYSTAHTNHNNVSHEATPAIPGPQAYGERNTAHQHCPVICDLPRDDTSMWGVLCLTPL